jgi:hypothetical protein
MQYKMTNDSEDLKVVAWGKTKVIESVQIGQQITKVNTKLFRQDACSAWIAWDEYGCQSNFGWEIDLILPPEKGGTEIKSNLRALNWKNKQSKGNDFPFYKSAMKAELDKNIQKTEPKTVNKELLSQLKVEYPENPFLQ